MRIFLADAGMVNAPSRQPVTPPIAMLPNIAASHPAPTMAPANRADQPAIGAELTAVIVAVRYSRGFATATAVCTSPTSSFC
jgi:hypothetical protein